MVNSTNETESNERTNTRTNQRTNTRTDKRQGESYIPLGINAGGIIILLAAMLFNGAKQFEQFWLKVTQRTFLYCFKIRSVVKHGKSFKLFAIFSSNGNLVQRSNFGGGS